MNFDFADILIEVIEAGASDLHLTAGSPPMIRVNGLLRRLSDTRLQSNDTTRVTRFIMPPDRRQAMERQNESTRQSTGRV